MKSLFSLERTALFQALIVAEQGSFHKAASLLSVKTSTLSRRIHELEARIGVSFSNGIAMASVRPTPARVFFENMQRIKSDIDSVLINARGRGEPAAFASASTCRCRPVRCATRF